MNKIFWDTHWQNLNLKYRPDYIPPLFKCWEKYLPKNNNLTCLEIGCVPGRLLVYLKKRYGYKIVGVDYSDSITKVEENFKLNEISDYKLLKTDFLSLPESIKADILISQGFVEHFVNYKQVIQKHTRHLNFNGLIVISVPNFRFFQYFLHNIFDKKILNNHVLGVMDPNVISDVLKDCGLEVLLSRYYGTFDFWCDTIPLARYKRIIRKRMLDINWKIKSILNRLSLDDMPNKYLSPHIICIARKYL